MKKFGELYRQFRESEGIRLKDVAKAGISTSQLSRFERADRFNHFKVYVDLRWKSMCRLMNLCMLSMIFTVMI